MPKKFFRKHVPSHDKLFSNRWLNRLKPWLGHPSLWHLNRRSVAGGVAIGLFAGLIPGPFQMLSAALLSIPFRANLPVAVFTTLYTNPLTIVPLYLLAYEIGAFFTGQRLASLPSFEFNWQGRWLDALPAFLNWVAALGLPLIVGLIVLALILAPTGYVLMRGLWRLHVVWEMRQRQRRQNRNITTE